MKGVLIMEQTMDSAIILLHEIYGKNRHILKIQQRLEHAGYQVVCPNLLNREKPFDYEEQAEAYTSFIGQGGFSTAAKQVNSLVHSLRGKYRRVFIVGYSVGATIAWLLSRQQVPPDGIVGFYGSRIRDYPDIIPLCPALLVFPREEASFDVSGLVRILNGRTNLEIIQVHALHGFADPWSAHYSEGGAEAAFGHMLRFIRSHGDV